MILLWAKAQDDERMDALADRMEKHTKNLGTKNPMVAMALGLMIAKHGSKVFAEAGMAAMPNMTGEQKKGMEEAMEKANKAMEEYKEKMGN